MIRLKVETLAEKIRGRAFIFTCSYKTTWDNYIDEEEKEGHTFEEVINYMKMNKNFLDYVNKF